MSNFKSSSLLNYIVNYKILHISNRFRTWAGCDVYCWILFSVYLKKPKNWRKKYDPICFVYTFLNK